jgi:hypothetical protein
MSELKQNKRWGKQLLILKTLEHLFRWKKINLRRESITITSAAVIHS